MDQQTYEAKLHICSKVLAKTRVYYSSFWVLSAISYHRLEKILHNFI